MLGGTVLTNREQAAGLGVVIVPQGNGLASSLTAAENVLVPLLADGVAAAEAHRRTADGADAGRPRGVRQPPDRGALRRPAAAGRAGARVRRAGRVLLADEPTSDLDAANRERMMAALRAEADRGAIVVMATHDPEAAEQTDGELHLDEGVATWRRPLG